jgi:hypothetical protein
MSWLCLTWWFPPWGVSAEEVTGNRGAVPVITSGEVWKG